MKNLESKDLPLRKLDTFYQPQIERRALSTIKVFPSKLQFKEIKQMITPDGKDSTILSYLSDLNRAKNINKKRKNCIKDQQFIPLRACRKLKLDNIHPFSQLQNPQFSTEKQQQANFRLETLFSNNPHSTSILSLEKKKKIKAEADEFRETAKHWKEEDRKEMRFSFYNTIEKSTYFNNKFRLDESLEQRKSNRFQNMMNRTITVNNILEIVRRQHSFASKGGI